jgi:hypothetical protein
MQWHEKNSSEDGMVWSVVDSKAWKHIDAMWPNFNEDPKNFRFALTMDGMIHLMISISSIQHG